MKAVTILLLVFGFTTTAAISQSFNASGWCQSDNNVNCSNWPSEIDDVKRAVFQYSTHSGSCTGTLINQKTSQGELKQYFVTARHCINDADFGVNWNFNFNYQSPDCSNLSVPDGANINGTNRGGTRYFFSSPVTLIEEIALTDMAIIQINNPIPPHFNVYYAGWSVSFGQALQLPNYDIHHPRSDIKKVSKTFSTTTVTSYGCHAITEVVDIVINFLFGWAIKKEVRTRTVCSYVESPYYGIQFWSNGVVEPGSSGSSLLNNDGKIIGTLTGGLGSCDFPLFESFGRLNTSYNKSSSFRNAVNPNGNFLFNLSGRQIDTYDALENLSGQYFPAKDYQPNNQIKLKANGRISNSLGGILTIRSGADFIFESGQDIILKPGFQALAGSAFTAKMSEISARTSVEETKDGNADLFEKITQISLPDTKRFEIEKYYPDFKGTIDEKTYFSISPNPAITDQLTIDLIFNSVQEEVSILLLDQQGRQVSLTTENFFQKGSLKIDVSSLKPALYILKVRADQESFTEKVIKR